MSEIYVPHQSLLDHPHWQHSNLRYMCSSGSCHIKRVKTYLDVNEQMAEVDPRYWNFHRASFLKAVRWDYERQLKEDANDRPAPHDRDQRQG